MHRVSRYKEVIDQVKHAADLARKMDILNLLQPGLVREMIIADILGHVVLTSKRDADAHAPDNADEKYEYLTCKEGGSGQFDRMFARPPEKRDKSLQRISRNQRIYLAVFLESDQLSCKVIYELDSKVVLKEAERRLDLSPKEISHIGFSESWASENGQEVFRAP